jgi:transcriptional regulator with XRE-family HTH domain
MDNSTFYTRLKELTKSTGKSFNQIEKELSYPRNALSNYREKSMPSAQRLMELSAYFNVTPEYLFGTVAHLHTESHLVKEIYLLLNPIQRKEMAKICKLIK